MSAHQKLVERVSAATERLARMKARELFAEMNAVRQKRSRMRRENSKRRWRLGDVLIQCGLGEWTPQEVRGLVLYALDETGTSPTVRLGFRKRAEQGPVGARGPPKAVPE